MSQQGSFHVATGFGLDRGFLVVIENSLSRQGLALVREFSCCEGEFDVATGLDKTNSFPVVTVWCCVGHDREGHALTTRPGARDRHCWACMTEILCRDRLLIVVKNEKRKKGDPPRLGCHNNLLVRLVIMHNSSNFNHNASTVFSFRMSWII